MWSHSKAFRNCFFMAHGGSAPCYWCGRRLVKSVRAGESRATTEHIIPVSRGGTDEYHNLNIACVRCNFSRGLIGSLLANLTKALEADCQLMLARWLESREQHLQVLLHWEQVYHRRLTGEPLAACLAEIDEVLRFDMEIAA